MNFKKILVLLLLIVVTVGIGFGLYYLFFRSVVEVEPTPIEGVINAPPGTLPEAEPGAPTPGTPDETGALPTPVVSPIANGGLTAVAPVAPVPTIGASVSSSGAMNYYNRGDGKFYRIQPDGSVKSLSNKVFFNASNATFDPQGNKSIIEYPDGSNILYDFNTSTQVTLPQHWENFSFSPEGDKIASKSIGLDPASRYVVVSNPDGSGARPVQEMGVNDDEVRVEWSPNNQIIATATTGRKSGVDEQEIYLIGQNQENFRSITVQGMDFRPQWSPTGDRLLYSVAGDSSDWKPQLWITDAQGDNIGRNRRSFAVNTWADKCTFSDSETIYCAVPDELPTGAGLQPTLSDGTPDSIFKINLTTGLQTRVAIPEGSHTVESIMLSPDKKTMFFTDKGSGTLNKIMLK